MLQKSQPAKQLFPMECKILSVWTEKEFYGRAQLQLTTLVRFWAFRFIGIFFQFHRKTSFSSFPTKIRPNGFFFTIGRICSYSRNVLIWGSTLPIDICERVSRSVWFHLVKTAARFVKYSPSKISSHTSDPTPREVTTTIVSKAGKNDVCEMQLHKQTCLLYTSPNPQD